MARQRLTVKDTNGFRPSVVRDRHEQTVLSTQDFLELHSKFIQHKGKRWNKWRGTKNWP